jgi:hypothetical protein
MFAGDPKMQVMQEPNGTIRMMESDVPRDLLDFRIMYISFDTEHGGLDSPVFALWEILAQPELKTFMVEKKLGPTLPDSFRFSVPASDVRISGELYYVTVSQALDYILKTFPGFWAYETCENGDRGRTVYLNFFPTVPSSVIKFP